MLPLSSAIGLRLPRATEDLATKLARGLVTCEEGLVLECLEGGVDPDLVLCGGHTPLTFVSASPSGKWEALVRLLLESGASPNSRIPRGLPLLSQLTILGSAELVQLTLDKGAQVEAQDKSESPLLIAVHYRQVECLRRLLRAGADPNVVCNGNSALMWAAGRSNGLGMQRSLACLKLLLQYGALPGFRNPRGFTPLMAASLIREGEAVKALLSAGADPNEVDERGETALMKATYADAEQVISQLLANDADPNIQSKTGWTALMGAESRESLCRLLCCRANPNVHTNDGTTALHSQAVSNHSALALLLLEHGANVNARDGQGNTPLHAAVRCRSHEASHMLMDNGADANSVNDRKVSVLHDALFPWDFYGTLNIFSLTSEKMPEFLSYFQSEERSWTVEHLLDRGADPDLGGEGGVTPLMLASAGGDERLLRILLKAGASASARDSNGRTALAYSCRWGHFKVAQLLLSYGCPVNTTDSQNSLPIYYAAQFGHTDIVLSLMVELAFYVCHWGQGDHRSPQV